MQLRSATGDQGHNGQDRDQEQKRVNSDSTDDSNDQENRSNGEKHYSPPYRGFPELTRDGGLGPEVRFRPDVRTQTAG